MLFNSAEMVCRDFNETDYEALLELDHHAAAEVRPRLSDAELRTLRTHVHGKATCGPSASCSHKPGQSTSPSLKACSRFFLALDSYATRMQVPAFTEIRACSPTICLMLHSLICCCA